MGDLSNSAIIVIVIICCGAFVCCLAAMGWFYRRQDFEEQRVTHGWRPTNTQGDYMREVRQQNAKGMFHVARYSERSKEDGLSSSYPSRSDLRSEVHSGSGFASPV